MIDAVFPLFRTGEEDPLEGGGIVYQDHNGDTFWSFWGPRGESEGYEEYDYAIFTIEVDSPETLPEVFSEAELIQRSEYLCVTVERMQAMAASEDVQGRALFLSEMREVVDDLRLDPHPRTVTTEELLDFPFEGLPFI